MLVLTWGLRHFWKRWNIRKGCVTIEDWGTSYTLYWGFKKILCEACLPFNSFFGYKKNSKSFIFFHSLIIQFLWFVYGSNSRKRYTLRLLSKCSMRSTLLPIGVKFPQPFDTLFDFLRWGPFSLVLRLCSSKVITKWWKIYTKTDSRFQKS